MLVNLMVESRKAAKNSKVLFLLCDFAALRERIFFQDQIDHYTFGVIRVFAPWYLRGNLPI